MLGDQEVKNASVLDLQRQAEGHFFTSTPIILLSMCVRYLLPNKILGTCGLRKEGCILAHNLRTLAIIAEKSMAAWLHFVSWTRFLSSSQKVSDPK